MVPATQQGPIRWGELAREQLTCQETQDMLTRHTGHFLEMVVYQGANLWCNTSTGGLRPMVPVSQRRAVFQHVHKLSHAGQWATQGLVAARFVCPGLATDVVAWCKECTLYSLQRRQGDQAAHHHRGEDGHPSSQVQPHAYGHCWATPTVT